MNPRSGFLRPLSPGGAALLPTLLLLVGVGVLFAALPRAARAAPSATSTAEEPPPLRVALLQRMFVEVNENDARAAMLAWAKTMGRERGIPVVLEPNFLTSIEEVRLAFRRGTIDAVTLPADDYWALRPDKPEGPFIAGAVDGSIEEEYVLVVRKDRGLDSLPQLRGRSLTVYDNPRACLAPIWLETLLLELNGERIPEFFGRVAHNPRLSRVVLPVFFGQSDAALVTLRGFRLMSELNPQVGEQLVVLAVSPPVLPVVFCFRPGFTSPYRAKLLQAVNTFHQTSAGQQTLTLFQTDRLIECPVEAIAGACAMLDRHEQLRLAHPPRTMSVQAAPTAGPPRP
ncbi:phosphate/phosphite/phosphonate ABC transporter substrate-binding protein [Opitutus terrae]|uniref:ABC-type phosphate/phosphonate transport system periplasmic component-like protein n=1 Tax=Opitutus terrae (strain DSM 11246 / JCM 15787 / PB90-1) TaxID=452637 RepID=B2A069_OPITP|nr:PhnD/SsuA/transferrin family substrate-binding protein [Opitutus terrae]ACB77405.1 ABC-type phosphate/phosphonate transport system periplasmic component-like protein [Opitutus terrae PB90-1]